MDLSIGAPVVTRTVEAISKFRRIANDFDVPDSHFMVIATAALRTARNRDEIIDKVLEKTGTRIQLIDPQVEALFGAMGARSAFHKVPGVLCLDLGGGSVQMTWIDTSLPDYEMAAARAGQSRNFGAAKVLFFLATAPEHVQSDEKAAMRNEIRGAFADVQAQFPALKEKFENGEEINIYLAGGGFRGYGSVLMHTDPTQPYPFPNEGTYTVPGARFKLTPEMRLVNEETTGKIFGMSKRRRKQFPAILEVVEALIEAVPIRSATFCPGSNREGALMMVLPPHLREANPIPKKEVSPSVLKVLEGAMPATEAPNIFSLGLASIFLDDARSWQSSDPSTNASTCLHEAATRFTGPVGLSDLQRAILAIASCARWCGPSKLSPLDTQLYGGIKNWLDVVHPDACFWAEYIGSITQIIASFNPRLGEEASDRVT
jgi:retrograde regulation protein 2